MKGKVLEFNSASRTGTISADDGNRYAFSVDQWKSAVLPKAGSPGCVKTQSAPAKSKCPDLSGHFAFLKSEI
ncbi:hypothetical protein [Pseudomonas lundensis]|uniref:hypothetical protein n=1 Tax=Pseudomonas lundensis TaxID=86185 RepID=UPI000641FFD2|nr:hypothetical protein [Pseudomonas lundensis]